MEKQETAAPVQEDTAGDRDKGDASKPGEAFRALPGEKHGASLCFPNPLYTVFPKPNLCVEFTAVNIRPVAREKGKSREAFHASV